ncbi:hypothetical protein KKC13_04515 [bacterium]|nr:hypothetical protein [bacterium]MBU1958243.1 hypothetical protein [bacterium]
MHENNLRLIDEAISSEPIKNTFRLGWEFITLNKQFTFTIISVLTLLTLLGLIPVVGFIFSVFSSAFALAVQIYAGRLLYETENIETFVDEVHNADGEGLIKKYFAPALGAYMGWMVIGLLFIALVALTVGSMGVTESTLNNSAELLALLSVVGLPIIVIALLLSYVQPLVQANIIMSNNFQEGFFAVFTLFSVEVWKRAMQASYFKYMFWLGLLVLAAAFLFGLLFSLFSVIPFLNILLMIIFVYIFMIIMSVAAMMAKRIVE